MMCHVFVRCMICLTEVMSLMHEYDLCDVMHGKYFQLVICCALNEICTLKLNFHMRTDLEKGLPNENW